MSKFIYKFEAVKKVKLTFEKLIQKEVAEIELKIKAQNEELVLLQNEKISEKNRIMAKKSMRASEVQFMNNFEKLMDEKINACTRKLELLNKQLKEKMDELKKKSMEHKIFETLEEKHLNDFRLEQNRIEQKQFDEIASIKKMKSRD